MPYTKLEPVDVLAPATRVLRMQRPPVNSLSLEVLSSFAESLAEAESDPACRAVVLASASPTVFCAGLDITEMHEPKPERLHQFWHTLQEVWIKLSTSRVATIAAIEGHSPAGGCMLAMSCDWRVMALADPINGKPLTIGLNETKLGSMRRN
jgi:3,2-trans-enoyl-CoA isomerase